MTEGETSSYTSSIALGIHSNKKIDGIRKIHIRERKFKTWVAFVTFFFVALLMIALFLYASEFSKNKKSWHHKSNKTEDLHNIKPLSLTSKLITDVLITPGIEEPQIANRKMDHHPNHRYGESDHKKENSKAISNLYTENGWFPKPFELTREDPSEIAGNNLLRPRTKQPNNKETELIYNKLDNMGPPMRLRGVYMQLSHEADDVLEDKASGNSNRYYNLKEINELMQKDSQGIRAKGNWPMEKRLKSEGLPFRLPSKGMETLKRRQTDQFKTKNILNTPDLLSRKGKPLTILLDIYPLLETNFGYDRKPLENENYFTEAKNLKPHSLAEQKNRMIMKLHLYPKQIGPNGIFGSYEGKMMYPRSVHRAESRTFGLFPKYKKKKPHSSECSAIALFPNGKPVRAKWKDSDGDWVYAKQVKVKPLTK